MLLAAMDAEARPQDRVVTRAVKRRHDWAKWGLGAYFLAVLVFLYAPVILMAILSFQGYFGGPTWPFRGPISLDWWRALWNSSLQTYHANDIQSAAKNSLYLSLAAGAMVAVLAFTLSMAFRRHWRFRTDAVGANVIWGIPFGFLVMLAVWNRYDARVEEAARDLGADQKRTFREVTLPLVWTGIFGAFLFGFTLTWNDYDRSVLFQTRPTEALPLEIGGLTFTNSIRPDLVSLGPAATA